MTTTGPRAVRQTTPLYRYGHMAWLWRLLIAAALAAGGMLLWLGARNMQPVLVLMGAIILAPALFFGTAVIVAIDDNADGTLSFTPLLPWPRRATRIGIGRPRLRRHYQGDVHNMYAPAVWVRIGGWLPVYIDVLGDIRDRHAFALAFHLSASDLPRGSRGRSPT
jgi:hypothetical protein